jgi:hypothetical protein
MPPSASRVDARNLVLAKNRIFDALNLERVLFTLASLDDSVFEGAAENAYAVDATRGRFATMTHVYSLDDFQSILSLAESDVNQMFFDRDGRLYLLRTTSGILARVDIDP